MGVRALGDEVKGGVTDLDWETELEIKETALTTVSETGTGHAYFCFSKSRFFVWHPSKYCRGPCTYLSNVS